MNWRKYFAYIGFTQECEDESPGYTVGLACFLAVLIMACLFMAYAMFWKIQ